VRTPISKAAFYKACRAARPRFSRLRLGTTGRVTVRSALPDDWHCVWFEVNQVHEEDGAYYFDDDDYTVYMFVDALLSVVFYIERGVLISVSFSAQLREDQLDLAVRALRDSGFGRLVAQAALHTLQHAPESARRVLGAALKRLSRRPVRGRR